MNKVLNPSMANTHPDQHQSLMQTYARLDKAFVRGEACYLFDEQGNAYLDALSGIGVVSLGHCHPVITEAIASQARTLIHTSNIYQIPAQQKLADKLVSVAEMENCFFSNSGAEANEAAIKMARLFARKKNIENPNIIVLENAFHGRTLATLSATANRKVQAGFEPLVQGFVRAAFNDIQAIKDIAEKNTQVVAVLLEPVQGEGGIHIADENYLSALRELCDLKDWLLIFDEIQCGNGRTGKYFAYQHTQIKPDIVTTAKALGNGLPIGACLARGKAASLFQYGNHGSTYGGNHLVCAAALEVVNIISENTFLEQVNAKAKYLYEQLARELLEMDQVAHIRGKGLMLGIELKQDCPDLVKTALNEGLLINVTAGKVIRLLPPLVISEKECDIIAKTLKKIISNLPG